MESIFSLRIVYVDYCLMDPIPNLDVCFSDFNLNNVSKVPVVRVFGSTPTGQSTCAYIHGVFPYVMMIYDGPNVNLSNGEELQHYLLMMATSLDHALNAASGLDKSINNRHVFKISLLRGKPFYGYHDGEEIFMKIYFYYPGDVRRACELLQAGAIMHHTFQPHEGHIPYVLQLFLDYNLYGMNLLHSKSCWFRKPLGKPNLNTVIPRSTWNIRNDQTDVKPQSVDTTQNPSDFKWIGLGQGDVASCNSDVENVTNTSSQEEMKTNTFSKHSYLCNKSCLNLIAQNTRQSYELLSSRYMQTVGQQSDFLSSCPLHKLWTWDTVPQNAYLQPSLAPRKSTCELEIDIVATDILNRNISVEPGKNPGIAFLWEDEKARRRDQYDNSHVTAPPLVLEESDVKHCFTMQEAKFLTDLKTALCQNASTSEGDESIEMAPTFCDKTSLDDNFHAKIARTFDEHIMNHSATQKDLKNTSVIGVSDSMLECDNSIYDVTLASTSSVSPLVDLEIVTQVTASSTSSWSQKEKLMKQVSLDSVYDLLYDLDTADSNRKNVSTLASQHSNGPVDIPGDECADITHPQCPIDGDNNEAINALYSNYSKESTVMVQPWEYGIENLLEIDEEKSIPQVDGAIDDLAQDLTMDAAQHDVSPLALYNSKDFSERHLYMHKVSPSHLQVVNTFPNKKSAYNCPSNRDSSSHVRMNSNTSLDTLLDDSPVSQAAACQDRDRNYWLLMKSKNGAPWYQESVSYSKINTKYDRESNELVDVEKVRDSRTKCMMYTGAATGSIAANRETSGRSDSTGSNSRHAECKKTKSESTPRSYFPNIFKAKSLHLHTSDSWKVFKALPQPPSYVEVENFSIQQSTSEEPLSCYPYYSIPTDMQSIASRLLSTLPAYVKRPKSKLTLYDLNQYTSNYQSLNYWKKIILGERSVVKGSLCFKMQQNNEVKLEKDTCVSGDSSARVTKVLFMENMMDPFEISCWKPSLLPPKPCDVRIWHNQLQKKRKRLHLKSKQLYSAAEFSNCCNKKPVTEIIDKISTDALVQHMVVEMDSVDKKQISDGTILENMSKVGSTSPASCKTSSDYVPRIVKGSTNESLHMKAIKEKKLETLAYSLNEEDTLHSSETSQISKKIVYDFQASKQDLNDAKALHEDQHLIIMSMELHVKTRANFRPDSEFDEIQAIFYVIQSGTWNQAESGCIIIDDTSKRTKTLLQESAVTNLKTIYVNHENELFENVTSLVIMHDPDILVGYEIQMLSWGYLFARAKQLGFDLCRLISRIPDDKVRNRHDAEKDEFGADNSSEIHVVGRIILNLWRLMRTEVALCDYKFENIAYHLLHERCPHYLHQTLSLWFNNSNTRTIHQTGCNRMRGRVIDYYMYRTVGNIRLLKQQDIIGRTSELARLFGIQFYEVLTRGSQFRVESMMLRLARSQNYIAVTPGVKQRAGMKAPESVPLVMEPESRFYSEPVIVLDFQSLYPSIIIAYNYCFSTCLGYMRHLCQISGKPFPFGCTSHFISPLTLRSLLERDGLSVSPCGVAFVRSNIKRGVLPSMLEEILNARIMVKNSMKQCSDKATKKMLDHRQLGLKLIANVTFGYTSANFSGRMPCVEIADSIISKARETLERAIRLVHDNRNKWEGRVVYGDTDSLFIALKEGTSKKRAFEIAHDIVQAVTNDNPKPIKLKFEKIYQPCILQTKKRYVGYAYEVEEQQTPIFDAKGIETVRRDGCPAISNILKKSLQLLFETRNISKVKTYVGKQCTKLLGGHYSIQDCVIAKEYRGARYYKPGAIVPSLLLARKMVALDRRAEPRIGERVPYVVVHGVPGTPLYRLIRQPEELLMDPSLRLHGTYYVTRLLLPALDRLMSLLGVDVFRWYCEIPRLQRSVNYTVENNLESNGDRQPSKKVTISHYFDSQYCLSCGNITPRRICSACLSSQVSRQKTTVKLMQQIRYLDRQQNKVGLLCVSCCGTASPTDVKCQSRCCPILYERNKFNRLLTKATDLREVLRDCDLL